MKKPSPQFSLTRHVVIVARIVFLVTLVVVAVLVAALNNITNSASVSDRPLRTSYSKVTPLAGPLTLLVNTLGDAADTNVGDGICDTDAGTAGDQCTLRAAIQETNAAATGTDVINFSLPANSTITLNSPLPDIIGNLDLNGPGAGTLTIERNSVSGTPLMRIFMIAPGAIANISGLTVSRGKVGNRGAGIMNQGVLNLNNSVVSNNIGYGGVGLHNENGGTLTISNCTISSNFSNNFDGSGGGISSFDGTVTISDSVIKDNDADTAGGIYNNGTLIVTRTTLSGNQSIFNSVIFNEANQASTTLTNSTISGNAGGVLNLGGTSTVKNSTISNNAGNGAGNADGFGGVFNLENTIIAGNTGNGVGQDITGSFNSQGHNLIGKADGGGGFTNGINGDQVGTSANPIDPRLGPLANNGGPTQTQALMVGSPAIDAGNSSFTTDQRGQPRPIDDQTVLNAAGSNASDIGAYEAHTFEVNSTADTNDGACTTLDTGNGCTLREAIIAANTETGAEMIAFAPSLTSGGPATITLANVFSDLSSDMVIAGPGSKLLTVQRSTAGGTPDFRILTINSGTTVLISGLTISNGNLTGGNFGGGLLNDGTLTLTNTTVSGNHVHTAAAGGGVLNHGTLTLTNSTVSGNSANAGGGVFNRGTLTITNSVVSGNTGEHDGGGIYNNSSAIAILTNSTISANTASHGEGGGIFNQTGSLTLTNSTVSGNSANDTSVGGGIGGGLFNLSGVMNLQNTIIADNTVDVGGVGPDLSGTFNSQDYNLIGSTSGATISGSTTHNITNVNARLAALADNGGPTQTNALLAGSPALDAGNNSSVVNPPFSGPPFTDQRVTGFARIVDGPDANTTDTVDIGAFEAQVSVADIADTSFGEDGSASFPFDVGGSASITSVVATSSNTTLVPNNPANLSVTGSGSSRTLTINPAGDQFGTSTITVTVNGANSQSMSDTFLLTVNPIADTPSVTPATTNEDTQTSSGLIINRNAVDGAEVTHFKITNIANGTLFKSNGTTQINNGDFITFAEGNAGLKFTPGANLFSPGTTFGFQVQGATSGTGAGLSNAATATVTVNPVADTPTVTNATTIINKQSSAGLVVSRNAADGAEVTHFKITNIQNGTLFKNDGTTQIANGAFVTFAEGNAGLKFTPGTNLFGPGTTFSFQVQAATSGTGNGLSSSTATATITVTCVASSIVTNGNDSGAGSLRDAIINACPGGAIGFNIPTSDPGFNSSTGVYTITLTSGELTIDRSLTITGLGASVLTVKRSTAGGTPDFRICSINSGRTVTISGITIMNGRTAGGSGGGGIANDGTLTLSNMVISANRTTDGVVGDPGGPGGGIYNNGPLTLRNTTVSGNTTGNGSTGRPGGHGAGIYNLFPNTVTMTNSTVSGNQTGSGGTAALGGLGGGIFNQGTIALVNVTVSGNQTGGGSVAGRGAGIYSEGPGTLTNTTISGNRTSDAGAGDGGGIFASGTITLANSTVTNNGCGNLGSGGGIYSNGGNNITVKNTIVANNTNGFGGSGPDLSGFINSQDFNLLKNTSGSVVTGATAHNVIGLDPALGPLANNGGPTQTHALLAGSPALDAGSNTNLPPDTLDLDGDGNTAEPIPFDQRGAGFSRVVDGPDADAIATVDIGAFEAPINPIDGADFFVRQHYLDFLNRQPDQSGLDFWVGNFTPCGTNQQCIEVARINVSAAFYLSIEFQQTGYLVERVYKASYGNGNGASTLGGAHQLPVPVVRFNEFLPDTQEIGQGVIVGQGNWEQQLENNKQAFTAEFVQRSRFTTAFPNTMTAAQFVDTLNTNAGNPLSPAERNQLVSDLATNAKTRAQVLRAVAEDPDLNSAEFNRAFVLMQYFGYLRRNPNDAPDTDYTGYDFWLTKLNQFNGNFQNAEMVKAFISSLEYRQRFGP